MDQGPLGDLTALVLEEVHYSAMKYRDGAPLLLGMNLLMAALDVPEYTEKKELHLDMTEETKFLGQQGKQHLSCEVMPEASLRLKLKEHVNDCTRGHHHWLDLT
ncbi:hypothetical protein ROHU_027231 [Labeo rohita]|uniref:Uncharacterized protein n=1 Tax=Labeo rohita TaxID=84645 RepID=A0A498MBV0_LABRO|nr:hypothetical protein ROHU_012414 [Labeo rohita]RXN16754.1 hypothetical protein ROHU_027231 [Labeo rohita]